MGRSRKAGTATSFLLAAAVAAAPLGAAAEVVKPGEEQGLGLTPGAIPDILRTAKADPYAAPPAPACESIPREIAALDTVLGPDADAPVQKANSGGGLVADTVRGLIPHRGIIRLLTGASRRDKARNEAAMAGWTRRGYLKGMYLNLGCAERANEVPAVAAAAVAPAAPATEEAAEAAEVQAPDTAVSADPVRAAAYHADPPSDAAR
jgi:hypothetical protein